MPTRSLIPPALSAALILAGLALPATAWAVERSSGIRFGEHRYAHRLSFDALPACPGLLDTLYAMETMRRLTPFVDRVTMLDEQEARHVVEVEFSILGFHTTLVYERLILEAEQRIELRLLSHESTFPLVQFPTDFLATYQLIDGADGTRLDYTQDATMQRAASLPHQLVVRAQVAGFERRLEAVVREACP